jgi:hypothetical protein
MLRVKKRRLPTQRNIVRDSKRTADDQEKKHQKVRIKKKNVRDLLIYLSARRAEVEKAKPKGHKG